MSNKQLLERAAKAAGLNIDKSEYNGGGIGNTGFDSAGNAVLDWHNGIFWNPIKSDADAFRLMVDCNLMVDQFEDQAEAYYDYNKDAAMGLYEKYADHFNDKHAATRMAIVKAAAQSQEKAK